MPAKVLQTFVPMRSISVMLLEQVLDFPNRILVSLRCMRVIPCYIVMLQAHVD